MTSIGFLPTAARSAVYRMWRRALALSIREKPPEDAMPLLASDVLQRIRDGKLTLGLGVHHLRGSAVPMLARAAGFDFLFIDAEHGAISTPEISQIAIAALGMG